MNINWNITPVPAPRMTQSDKWNTRPIVARYFAFRDEVGYLIKNTPLKEIDTLNVDFYIPMPKSWSKMKRKVLINTKHKQKPDLDNLVKALLDSIFRDGDDSQVCSIRAKKFWAENGRIEIII